MKKAILVLAILAFGGVRADDWCIDGVCYLTKEDYEAALAERAANPPAEEEDDEDADEEVELVEATAVPRSPFPVPPGTWGLLGKREKAEFLAFLRDPATGKRMIAGNGGAAAPGEESSSDIPDWAKGWFWGMLALAFIVGMADNLTPCVYPLIPVNIAIIGRSWQRGLVYGIGQITGAGALGIAAALTGAAFGALQQNVWFNVVAALAMAVLGIAMLDVIHIDLSRFRKTKPRKRGEKSAQKSVWAVWGLGAASVLLAGACVEPVLLAILMETGKGVGSGAWHYVALPFAFGAGLALPWPFIGAGLGALPKPGAWMVWFKRILALVVFAFAAWYASIAWHLAARKPPKAPAAAPAAAQGKPQLWLLSAPWCMNCHEMQRTVLKDPEVLAEMRNFDVHDVEIDVFEDLAAYPELSGLDIRGLPTYIIFVK